MFIYLGGFLILVVIDGIFDLKVYKLRIFYDVFLLEYLL